MWSSCSRGASAGNVGCDGGRCHRGQRDGAPRRRMLRSPMSDQRPRVPVASDADQRAQLRARSTTGTNDRCGAHHGQRRRRVPRPRRPPRPAARRGPASGSRCPWNHIGDRRPQHRQLDDLPGRRPGTGSAARRRTSPRPAAPHRWRPPRCAPGLPVIAATNRWSRRAHRLGGDRGQVGAVRAGLVAVHLLEGQHVGVEAGDRVGVGRRRRPGRRPGSGRAGC